MMMRRTRGYENVVRALVRVYDEKLWSRKRFEDCVSKDASSMLFYQT